VTYYVRNLPHWQPPGTDLFITWRLYGSPRYLPTKSAALSESSGKRFLRHDRLLDAAQSGPLWLKDDRIARQIISILQELHSSDAIRVQAYAIMANHVHVLLEPKIPIAKITKRIKGRTAREANRILNFSGSFFWQHESFDHWVRTPAERQRIRNYIEQNPVKAGLVAKPEDWPWSSASQ
jgi:putative transposase